MRYQPSLNGGQGEHFIRRIRRMKCCVPALLLSACVTCVFAVVAAPALAAAPETPETVEAKPITATTATLHGVLDPNNTGEAGSYAFSYEPSSLLAPECGAPGTLAPSSPVADAGVEGEAKTVALTGLEPNKEYAFCIVAYSLSAEPSYGTAVPFTTLPLAPKVDGETAAVTATTSTFEAQINPNNEQTTYTFEYATKEKTGALEGTIVKIPDAEPLPAVYGDQTATVPNVEGLTAGMTYYFRVVAKNAQGITSDPVQSFTTVPVPHTDPVTAVTATMATFHGHLTLDSVDTKYFFDYNVGAGCTGGSSSTPGDAGAGSTSKAVSTAVSELQPSATYSVCLVSVNAFGSEVDPTTPLVHFTTLAAPPKVDGESATVLPFEATLEAQVNPNNQTTTYAFEYAPSEAELVANEGTTLRSPAGTAPLEGYGDRLIGLSTGSVLTSATPYFYRVIAENAAHEKTTGAPTELVTATAEKPAVEGESATDVTAFDATVKAQVNPEYQTTTYTAEYATEATLLGTAAATTVPGASLPAGGSPQPVSVELTGLQPNTPYFYRIVATNKAGTFAGATETFTTLIAPVISAGEAEGVTANNATLPGTVNPEEVETTYHYEYVYQGGYEAGLEQGGNPYAYGGASTPEVAIGSDSTPHAADEELSGLAPGTTYHYALVAKNADGVTVFSPDRTFTTAAAEPEPAEPVTPTTAESPQPLAAIPATLPAIPYTPIAQLDATEAKEGKAVNPPSTKSLTNAQKLSKALKACRKKKGASRAKCEKQAHDKYGSKKKKK
jgi:hypothetical protein